MNQPPRERADPVVGLEHLSEPDDYADVTVEYTVYDTGAQITHRGPKEPEDLEGRAMQKAEGPATMETHCQKMHQRTVSVDDALPQHSSGHTVTPSTLSTGTSRTLQHAVDSDANANPQVPPKKNHYSPMTVKQPTRPSTRAGSRTSSHANSSTPIPSVSPAPAVQIPDKIYFYHRHQPHYGFTNFSAHQVKYKGKIYPTSEHLFQSFKFLEHRPLLAEHIRTFSNRACDALSEARRFQPEQRPDWFEVNITKMEKTLLLKFEQHPTLSEELLRTGDAELIEDSDKDWFWGVGSDRTGRNELGRALERVRADLRAKTAAHS